MSIIGILRQNNPATTCVGIHLDDESSGADLAEALEQNPFVTSISLDLLLGDERWPDWSSLVRVIATRTILEKVRCRVPFVPTARRNERAALVRSILQAIQQNSSIQSVELEHLLLTPDLVTFVDTASSITTLSLLNIHYDMDMESAEREQGTRSLAVALQRNKNIQSLKMPC